MTTDPTSSTFSSSFSLTSPTAPAPQPQPVLEQTTSTTKSPRISTNDKVILSPWFQVYFARSSVFYPCAHVQAIPTKRWDNFTTEATSSTFSAPSHTIAAIPTPQPKSVSEKPSTFLTKTKAEVSFVALLQQCGRFVIRLHHTSRSLCLFLCFNGVLLCRLWRRNVGITLQQKQHSRISLHFRTRHQWYHHHVPNRNQNQQQAQQELPNPRPTMRSALVSCCSSVHGFVVLLQMTSLLRSFVCVSLLHSCAGHADKTLRWLCNGRDII